METNNIKLWNDSTKAVADGAKKVFDLPVSLIDTKENALLAWNTYEKIDEMSAYKKVKILEVIETKNLFMGKFDDYAKNVLKVKKSQFYNYKNARDFIDNDGNHSIFFNERQAHDFSVTALIKLKESGISIEQLQQAIDKGDITPLDSVQKLTATLKKMKGLTDDITSETIIGEPQNVNEDKEQSSAKAESNEKEMSDYVKQSALYKETCQKVYELLRNNTQALTGGYEIAINLVKKN